MLIFILAIMPIIPSTTGVSYYLTRARDYPRYQY